MASRIPPGRITLRPFWPQVGLKMAQVASKLPLSCHLASDVAGKLPQDASEEGFRPSRCHLRPILAPSWLNLAASGPHLDGQNGHFVWEGLHFCTFRG